MTAEEFSGSARPTWTTDFGLAKWKLSVRDTTTLMTHTSWLAAVGWNTPLSSPKRAERRDHQEGEGVVGVEVGRTQATHILPRAIMTQAISGLGWVT